MTINSVVFNENSIPAVEADEPPSFVNCRKYAVLPRHCLRGAHALSDGVLPYGPPG
ncbi:MAG: hypothetical protein JXR95_10275 [Deltaproteobacteria bacterium]|nr:hypothetical protein [Deltaproteobacteria bacterium]